ncbi:MAG: hypothetical protein AB7G08_33495 [Hyphomicrobiaceae bacterium]
MSFRWLYHPPVVALTLVIAGLAGAGLIDKQNNVLRAPEAGQQKPRTLPDTSADRPATAPTISAKRDPNADRKEWRAENNLLAQQQTAEWTKWAAIATWFAGLWTAIGIILIWHTLVATRSLLVEAQKTTEVAADANKAAWDAVDHGRKGAEAAMASVQVAAREAKLRYKPWIAVELIGPFVLAAPGDNPVRSMTAGEPPRDVMLNAIIKIECLGDMPATIEKVAVHIGKGRFKKWPTEPPYIPVTECDMFLVLRSGAQATINPALPSQYNGNAATAHPFTTFTLDSTNMVEFRMHPPSVEGWVLYSDPFGNRYRHKFAFIAQPTWGDTYIRFGGRELNYEQEALA